MGVIMRFGHVKTRFLYKPYIASIIGAKPINHNVWLYQNYGQPARKEEDELEEIYFDPRQLRADYDPSKFDPSCHRSPPSYRVLRLVDEVSMLTLKEAAELAGILIKKMGMAEAHVIGVLKGGAIAGLAQMGVGAAGGEAQEEMKPEKMVFELKLESFERSSKIKVIKEIRSFTDLGLKEAKALVEISSIFKTGVSKEEAQQIIDKMEAVGANVTIE